VRQRHVSQWHVSQWHVSQWHVSQWHVSQWHVSQWHVSQWHVSQWYVRQWYVSRADAVAVRDRGQPLHVRTQQPSEGLGLGVAEGGKLLGHMLDRAVMLADLYTLAASRRRSGRRSVAISGQRLGQRLRARGPRLLSEPLAVPRLEIGDPGPGEGGHRTGSAGLTEVAQRGGGDGLVAVAH
jgi:hypothetical protein